jgi:hypothetical protein
MALPRPASATTRPHNPEYRHRLRHAFKFMAAALLGDEQTGDLALHLRRYYDRPWLCQRLHRVGGLLRSCSRAMRRDGSRSTSPSCRS